MKVARERSKRVNTAQLNKLIKEATEAHPPPSKPGKWVKFYYATQADVKPPTFIIFTNDADAVHFSYKRYIENQIRGAFGFEGTPIRLVFRDRASVKLPRRKKTRGGGPGSGPSSKATVSKRRGAGAARGTNKTRRSRGPRQRRSATRFLARGAPGSGGGR